MVLLVIQIEVMHKHYTNLSNKTVIEIGIPFPANNDLLTARELKLSSTKRLLGMMAVAILAANRKKDLTNGYSSTSTLGFSKCTSHSCLKPISSRTRKHLIDPKNMEWMHSNSQVESILPSKLGHIFVASNPSCFQSLT